MRLATPEHELAYYTVADSDFFLGAAALLNSLRLQGEDAPFFIVDCGLTRTQQELLAPHATIVPPMASLHPQLQKATGQTTHPAETMVFIDADILITRSLDAVVELAAANGVAAFKDIGNPHRFCPEWSTFGIGEAVERPYVNSGFFALTYEVAIRFIPIFVGLEQRLDVADSYRGGAASTSPLYFLDQDVFNAMLCTQFADSTARLEAALVPIPPFTGLRSSQDLTSCAYEDGTVPFGLHHVQRKPWLAPLSASLYSELFTTVLTTTDAPVRISPRELPLRLRTGKLARVDRLRATAQDAAHRRLRGRLGLRAAVNRRVRTLHRPKAPETLLP